MIIGVELGCDDSYSPSSLSPSGASIPGSVPCGARLTLTGAKSAEAGIEMAALAGWWHDPRTGLDYCPSCTQLLDSGGRAKSNAPPTATE